ncbi:PspC domain-containing protein [Arthrobacter sp. Sa2CUA1]|uniref:PspC domain-containing protein n=1 Tax=Arthrobacter gallicola TaxID=2762225 RepID=A0ABR8URY5_9MICC|nr:ATP-binding protein [Arthrobacter gallicola]MBD7995130.1 PspC domain-containing protein [Arthrobacter gallicola]
MRPPLLRSPDRVVAGVCSGLATHLGMPVRTVRVLMALLSLLAGAGVLLYAWLWIMVPTTEEDAASGERNPRSVAENFARYLQEEQSGRTAPGKPAIGTREILIGLMLLLAAAAVVAQRLGAEINLGLLLPFAAIAAGAVLAWSQLDATRRAGLVAGAGADRKSGLTRLIIGLLLVIAGFLLIVSGSITWDVLMAAVLAALAVLAGVALVLAPWGVKYWRAFQAERAGRIRQTERAEIAAHLHDSVLQTLALIQNRAGSESEVIKLARAQERELRQWLYADPEKGTGTLADALKGVAAEVEDSFGHPVDFVAVGTAELTVQSSALVQAARAALFNAAQHAGGQISLYLECRPDAAEVFVRDRGSGFDQDAVPEDRLGLRESIVGRMQRHGGTAGVKSSSAGTEIHLALPLAGADAQARPERETENK